MKYRAIVLSLSMLFLIAAAPARETPVKPKPVTDWTYEACFSLTGHSPCYDVYRHNGQYWLCSACGTTTNPSETTCRRLDSWELYHGYWCS